MARYDPRRGRLYRRRPVRSVEIARPSQRSWRRSPAWQVATVRNAAVTTPDTDLPPANLTVPDTDIAHGRRRFAWLDAPDGDYWRALTEGQVLVSEPFAYRRGITPESNTLTLLTGRGPHTFTVAGVYYDYTTDQGAVMMARDVYLRHFDDPALSAVALILAPGAHVETVIDAVRRDVPAAEGLQIQSNRALRENALGLRPRFRSRSPAPAGDDRRVHRHPQRSWRSSLSTHGSTASCAPTA